MGSDHTERAKISWRGLKSLSAMENCRLRVGDACLCVDLYLPFLASRPLGPAYDQRRNSLVHIDRIRDANAVHVGSRA